MEKTLICVLVTGFTTWDTIELVMPKKLPSPEYCAVMGHVPALRLEMEKVAVAVLAPVGTRVAVPIRVTPL